MAQKVSEQASDTKYVRLFVLLIRKHELGTFSHSFIQFHTQFSLQFNILSVWLQPVSVCGCAESQGGGP